MKYLIILTLSLFLFGCSSTTQKPEVITQTPANSTESSLNIDASKFALANDAVCGMPLKDGAGDTATYNGKLYGFCGKECKDKFLKNPGQYLK